MKLLDKISRGLRQLTPLLATFSLIGNITADEPVALRAESFTVPPSTQPLAFVAIKNLQEVAYKGSLTFNGPRRWRIAPAARNVSLAPGETKRVPFTIERGTNVESNSYPVEISASGAGMTLVRKQNVACASAPYFKPTIDGAVDEWKDSIPVTFTTEGKKTVVSAYWNRRQFSLLVAVEEDRLLAYRPQASASGFDAVQVAISPQDSRTGTSPGDEANRHEFLFVSVGIDTSGKSFQLASPGTKLSETAKLRDLGSLELEKAKVAVTRKDGVTYYECAIPFRLMRDRIRPGEGREFFMSVLVHDRDGTGIRDLGEALGLWATQRNKFAWCSWQGVKWDKEPPFDNKCRWGLCASKY